MNVEDTECMWCLEKFSECTCLETIDIEESIFVDVEIEKNRTESK